MDELPKPNELLAARTSAETLFGLLRAWFDVPMSVTIDLRAVDSAVAELGEPQLVMAMAMRKLQALHLLTTPGVRTTTDVVLTVIQDLERALLQAPAMHLKRSAARTDWDAALAKLDDQLGGTGAWSRARSRSWMTVSTTSVVVGTPGVVSRCSACSLRIAMAITSCGSPSSATAESTARRSMVTDMGTSNHARRRPNNVSADVRAASSSLGLGSSSMVAETTGRRGGVA